MPAVRLAAGLLEGHSWPRKAAEVAAAVVAALAVATFIAWWMRALIVGWLLLAGAAFVVFRKRGPLSRRERITMRVYVAVLAFFTVGSALLPWPRAIIAGGFLAASFVLWPVRKRAALGVV